jgi:monoamine oxidase
MVIRGSYGEEASPISLIAGADDSAEWPGYMEGAIRSGPAAAAL